MSSDETYQRVCVKEDALGVLDQFPAVEFREGDSELWTFQELQMDRVVAVKLFHVDNKVKTFGQKFPGGRKLILKLRVFRLAPLRNQDYFFNQFALAKATIVAGKVISKFWA